MASHPRLIAALLAAAALGVAGCGSDSKDRGNVKVEGGTDTGSETGTAAETTGTTPAEATPRMPVATIKVTETEYKLDPANPHVSRTGNVVFRITNSGGQMHALEVEGPGGEEQTAGIEPGGSSKLTVNFTKAGSYEWYCPIADHKARGMKGKIKIGSPASIGPDDKGSSGGTGGEAGGSSGSSSGGSSGGGY